MSLTDFFAMGGYGLYVWSSYGITVAALILNIILPVLKERKTMRELQGRLYNIKNSNQ